MDRRSFLSMLAAAPLMRLPGVSEGLPRLEPMVIGKGLPATIGGWDRLTENYPELIASEPAWIDLDAEAWRRLCDDIDAAPRFDYLPVAGWTLPSHGFANCTGRSLAVRAFLAASGWPLGALRPVICWSGEQAHMGLCIVTRDGDLFMDSIGNVVGPWREFPYQWAYRYAAGRTWERLAEHG